MSNISRRKFLKTGAAALAGITIAPSTILGMSHGHISPTDKLNLAAVGIGGMGHANINHVKGTENIVALCDVDWKYAKGVFDEFPKAKKYWDYRKMYEEMGKSIDGVIIATADHTHAIITADAMTMGKHVYCQKPLTHSVYESRLLTKLAASTGVVTQMGNQGASDEGTDLVCEWIWNGEIGDVTKVECATDRPIWPQGLNVPEKVDKIPSTLNWDLFTGPAKMNPYNAIYHPWNWRGWWDYGTGALGDMACHILHQPFKALKLQYPTKVEGSSTLLLNACAPQAQHVKMIFPARENMPKVAMPEVEVHWYDGGMMPERPKGFPEGKQLMQSGGGLTIFHGTKGFYSVRNKLFRPQHGGCRAAHLNPAGPSQLLHGAGAAYGNAVFAAKLQNRCQKAFICVTGKENTLRMPFGQGTLCLLQARNPFSFGQFLQHAGILRFCTTKSAGKNLRNLRLYHSGAGPSSRFPFVFCKVFRISM